EKISGIAGGINDFRYHNLYDNYLWMGSQHLFGGPILYFSSDSGKTWDYDLLETLVTGDNAIFSIAFNPNDPDIVYASMFKRIIKTTDGGASWFIIMSYSGPGYIFSIVEDDSQSDRLFAATGFTALETRDGGKNWFDLESPNGSGIVTMLYDSEYKALYIGTGSGPNPPNGVFVYKKTN
ncbi:MAG: WD40/YVTN/BNR-like repeat-containing protein, partial [bacterium]